MTYVIQRLGDLCNVRIGRTPRRDSPHFWGGSATWVTVRELNGGVVFTSKEQISDLAVREVMQAPIPAGTLLFSFKLSIGKMAIAGTPLYTNEAIAALVVRDANVIDRDYLRFALMATSSADGANHAVLGKVLNKEKVEGIKIPVPPLAEQRRIVDILSRAEGIIRLRREAEKKAAELIPALFLDMFGDPAMNPKVWSAQPLDQLCDLVRGSSPRPQGDPKYFGGPVPRLMIADITRDGVYVTPTIDSLTVEGAKKSRPMKKGEVVMAVSGAVGLPAILDVDACIHDGFVGFRSLSSKLSTEYFYNYLASIRRYSVGQAVGATFQNLKTDQIREWSVPIPPYSWQARFQKQAEEFRGLEKQQFSATAKAQATFDALLSKTFFY